MSSLDKMESAWSDVLLDVEEYRQTRTHIVKDYDVYLTLLDEQLTITQVSVLSLTTPR